MLTLRQQADGIHLAEDAERWIVAFAQATRLHDQLQLGLSPRGSLAIATWHGRKRCWLAEITSGPKTFDST